MSALGHNLDRTTSATARRRRGVSLLEVMVALAIVIATAALVLPWTAGWLGDRELDQAEDQLAMQFLMARAAAREQGRPVEVVVDDDESGVRNAGSIEARWMSPAVVPGDDDAGDGDQGEESFLGFAGADDTPSAIKATWARFELPRGVRVNLDGDGAEGDVDRGESSARDRVVSRDGVAEQGPAEKRAGIGSQTLAIFLPDGTAVFAPIFLLSTDAGAIRALQVDSITGKTKPVAARGADGGARDGDDARLDRPESERPEFERPEFEPPVDGVRGERGR
jgi:prepilin-type N-terminal cleavage/methylation domain-containing protein